MTPLAHAAVGMTAWKLSSRRGEAKALFIFMLVSCLPDIDLLFYHLFGRPEVFKHQLYSHNIFFALLSAAVFFPLLKTKREKAALTLVALSHLVMDVFVVDDVAPVGFRPFWPLSNLLLSFGFFPYVRRGTPAQVLTVENLFALGLETALFAVPALIFCRRELGYLWKTRVLKKDANSA
ncbi:MAG: metal-dependent hydrolase [Candidatus Aminicenantes bacterium]|nr:metal-dependent hydrolase [Candidatus Aminicenantes bacterium]